MKYVGIIPVWISRINNLRLIIWKEVEMIKIVAKNYIKNENIEDFIKLASKLVEATNKYDEGCIKYELFQDTVNPGILTVIEEWESKDALDKHMAASHFTEIVPQFAQYTEKPGEMNIYNKIV